MITRLPSWWAAVPLVVVLGLGGGGFYAGFKYCKTTVLADQADQAQSDLRTLQKEVTRSVTAAQQSIKTQQELQTSYSNLEVKFNEFVARGPLVVVRRGAAAANCSAGHPIVTDADTADLAGRAAATQAMGALAGSVDDGEPGYGLSRGAVWMWNSALTGSDTPAGACGAADTAAEACAADSGISIEAAWANHTANAKSCAADRLRHQQLIDYLDAAP